MAEDNNKAEDQPPKGLTGGRIIRALINAASGAIPLVGGIPAAISAAWSEKEQQAINDFFQHHIEMLKAELAEKGQTVLEIIARLDMNDKKTAERVASPEYQSLVKQALRDWAGTESRTKREYIRNILANAASCEVANDDVIRLFLKWLNDYSEMHFSVIGAIYNDKGVTRGRIWEKIGKDDVREDSAEADLFKLLIRDLSTGSIIRQHREKDYAGNFLKKPAQRRRKNGPVSNTVESAFDDTKGYELTELGQRFVHYAMTDLPLRLETGAPSSVQEDNAACA